MRVPMLLAALIAATPATFLAAQDSADRAREVGRRLQALEDSIRRDQELLKSAENQLLERRLELQEVTAEAERLEQRYTEARLRAAEARKYETEVYRRLQDRLNADPKALAAREELLVARTALAELRQRILEPVRETSSHRRATVALQEARDAVHSARLENRASPGELAALAAVSLERSTALAAIENAALEAEADYIAARDRVTEARAALGEVNRQIADQIRVDEDRIAAVAAVQETKAIETAAAKEADRVRRQLSAARRAFAQADAVCETIRRRLDNDTRLRQHYLPRGGVQSR